MCACWVGPSEGAPKGQYVWLTTAGISFNVRNEADARGTNEQLVFSSCVSAQAFQSHAVKKQFTNKPGTVSLHVSKSKSSIAAAK